MFTRRVSAITIVALLGSLLLAVPAQAIINDGGGGGGGGGSYPAVITLDDQTGDVQLINTQLGASVSLPGAEWTGHTFTGWWTAPEGGTKLVSPIVVMSSATYYAQWTLNSYTVTFEPGNGEGATSTTADYQSTISAPSQPSRPGYAFGGWFTSASGGTAVTFPYTVTGDATLYAQWISTSVTLTIDDQDGTSPDVITQPAAFAIWLGTPIREGYTFAGYWSAPTGGTSIPVPFGVYSDTTVYAHWTINSYTVTFEPGNGDASVSNVFNYGAAILEPTQPARANHQFDGWFTAAEGGTKVTFPYTLTGDVTLYAQWTINSYTVTFEPGNGDTASSETADYGTSIVAPTQPVLANHQFDGWFTAAEGGTQVTFPYTLTGDVTLYAQWTINTHTVTFEPGNGDAASSAGADYGSTVNAPTEPTRPNYTLAGWFTAADGGTQVTFPYTLTGDVTLYAQWTHTPASFSAPSQAAPGETITINAHGFQPGEAVEVWLLSTPVLLATVQADANGSVSTMVTIPSGTTPGSHHIELRGELSGTFASALTVTEALAGTGANIGSSALVAALLMFAGFALLVTRRRPRA